MDCDLCFYGDSDCSASVYNESWRGARKQHRCCECRRTIERGERYHYTFGVWDGDADQYTTCAQCAEIRVAFACEGAWIFGQLWDNLESSFGRITTGCFEKLETAAAKSFLREKYIAWKFQ